MDYIPRKFVDVPCCDHECQYSEKVKNGLCRITIDPVIRHDKIEVGIVCKSEDELRVKLQCFTNYIYENTGTEYSEYRLGKK